jgi:GT2 family glycosyltransferase
MFNEEIAIVILNFNGVSHLRNFLPSVIANSQFAQIYVIDNASTDQSVEVLHAEFPEILLIQNTKNYGFAEGYNQGLSKINENYPYLVLLNSDVEVTKNWLMPLYELMQANPSMIATQPKILAYQEKNRFEHAGAAGGYLDKHYFPFCRGRIFDHLEPDQSQYNTSVEVTWTSGAAMMVRAKEFKNLGGFDPDFFAHMEEIDWCLRAQSAGYKLVFCPESTVYHLGGGTMPYSSPFKTYLNFRNNLSLIIKNHQGFILPILFFRMLLDGVAAFKFLVNGKPALLWAILKAHVYTYIYFSKNLKKRKQIKSMRKQPLFVYKGSILWNYFIQKNFQYDKLNKRRFEL